VKYVRLLLGFGISLGFVALLLRAVDVRALGAALKHAQPASILPALALYAAAAWLRSVRWGLMLPPGSAPTSTLARALLVGFTVNNLLPARLGEAARAFLLKQWANVPVGVTVASVVVERILDGLALAVLLLLAIWLLPTAPSYLLVIGLMVGGGFAAGALLLAAIAWRPGLVLRTVQIVTKPTPLRIRDLAERITLSFVEGLALVRGWRLLGQLAAFSVAAWLCETGVFYVLMFGFSIPASPALAILGGSAANFATLVPSSPGYVGTFDGVLVKVVTDVVGPVVAYEEVLAYALVVRTMLFLPVTVAGLVVLWRSNLSFGEIVRFGSARRQAAASEPGRPEPAPERSYSSSLNGPAITRPALGLSSMDRPR
jgi:uncharacterized protein (TIRG00374 family)